MYNSQFTLEQAKLTQHARCVIAVDNKISLKNTVTPPYQNADNTAWLSLIIGSDIPSGWDGESFAANLRGKTDVNICVDRDYLTWNTGLYAAQRSVRSKTHLYQHTYHPGTYEHISEHELFDMHNDPNQVHNFSDEHPELVKQYQAIMDDRLAEQQAKSFTCTEDPLMRAAQQHATAYA